MQAGDALHLAGPNGIGKSSLLRILAGLMRAYAGSVTATGAIALSDERLALDAHQPLGTALAFWQRLDGQQPMQANFGLDDLADVPVRYLSTGQRKRAALACVAASGAAIEAHRAGGGIAVIASLQALDLQRLIHLSLLGHVP